MALVLSSLIIKFVFAIIGWLAFRKSTAPRKPWVWLMLLIVTILAGYVGVSSRLVSFSGFEIYLNDCLQGLSFGLLAGFLIRK